MAFRPSPVQRSHGPRDDLEGGGSPSLCRASIPSMSSSIELTRIRPAETSRFLTEDVQRPPSPHDIGEIFGQSRSYDEDVLAGIHPLWKRDLHALLEQPTSSAGAFLVHLTMNFLIATSALVTVLETVPAFHSISTRVWFGLETALVALFTVEYIARCVAWSGSWMSLFRWMTCTYAYPPLLPEDYAYVNTTTSVLRNHRLAVGTAILYRDCDAAGYSTFSFIFLEPNLTSDYALLVSLLPVLDSTNVPTTACLSTIPL